MTSTAHFTAPRTIHPSKDQVISFFEMQPHPEGGYFKETYRSPMKVTTEFGERSASTAIYFLLGHGDRSHFHRLKSDECWHYYGGESLNIVELIEETKSFKVTVLGPNILNNEKLQHIVPAGVWFGSYFVNEDEYLKERVYEHKSKDDVYSLVGCTVSPGFDFNDFELANHEDLLRDYPAAMDMINRLTPKEDNIRKITGKEEKEEEKSEEALKEKEEKRVKKEEHTHYRD